MGRPGPLGIRLAVTVQPGCTNLGLGTLLHSRTNADDDGRMGCSQARAQAESISSTASVCAHTLILGEHTANINSAGALRFFTIGDAVRTRAGGQYRTAHERESAGLLRIGTPSAKIDGSIETRKYRGERLVSSAAGPDFGWQ
jgi:hypothetical protein